jgi:hypothetical protein
MKQAMKTRRLEVARKIRKMLTLSLSDRTCYEDHPRLDELRGSFSLSRDSTTSSSFVCEA